MENPASRQEGKKPEKSQAEKALNRAMNLCSKAEYCSSDIRQKLESWGLGQTASEQVIRKLIKENFINEERYAGAYVRDKYRHNKWGRVKIAAMLKAKGIPSGIIDSALSFLDEEEYRQMIKDMILSRRKSVKAKNQYDLKGKLLRYGLSKGFESSLLYDILNDLD
jgi:regulatory protein